MESVLLNEFNVSLLSMGKALSKFFGVPYEPYRPGRVSPSGVINKLTRAYVEANFWVPIENSPEGLVILSTDPERHHKLGTVSHFFPNMNLLFRVCTIREFRFTVDQLYGSSSASKVSLEVDSDLSVTHQSAFDGWVVEEGSALNQHQIATYSGVETVAEFTQNLERVSDKIQATQNFDEIMQEVSNDICCLFDADRLSIYEVGLDKISLVSKIQTGLRAFEAINLPISEQSIAGYAALKNRMLNIADAYNNAELSAYSPNLRMMQNIDRCTGYRTRQILVAPIMHNSKTDNELVGVIQLINNKTNRPFPVEMESGLQKLTQVLATALCQVPPKVRRSV